MNSNKKPRYSCLEMSVGVRYLVPTCRTAVAGVGATSPKQAWSAELPAQMKAVADALAAAPGVLSEAGLSERFTGRGAWKKRLPQILATLCALGRAQASDGGWRRV